MWGTDFASSTRLSFIYVKHSLSDQQMNGKAKAPSLSELTLY